MAKRKKRSIEENKSIDLEHENALLKAQLKQQNRDEKVEKGKKKSRSNELDCCPNCSGKLTKIRTFKASHPTTIYLCNDCDFRKTIDDYKIQPPREHKEDGKEYIRQSCEFGSMWDNNN